MRESVLGDPNFPKVAIEFSMGGKTRVCQELYTQYSRLEFTRQQDRPVGIAGLEQRMIQSFNIRGGGFGVLDGTEPGLLRRSLLWHRAVDNPSMEEINFHNVPGPKAEIPTMSPPPTWSWMAYKGAIEYLHVPFDQVLWEDRDIESPWLRSASGTWSYSGDRSENALGLRATARVFEPQAPDEVSSIILDAPAMRDEPVPALMCVILGMMKNHNQCRESTVYFVLMVTAEDSRLSEESCKDRTFRRKGVGRLPGSCIGWDKPTMVGQVR